MSTRSNNRRSPCAAVVLSLLILLGGCAAVPVNAPLSPAALNNGTGPISKAGYRLAALPQKEKASDLLVLVSFSGGGMRSAAFGYGVLKGLRDFSLPAYGDNTHLLDAVDVISAVSGGSFPAAYYGLYRDRIFTDFDKDFLDKNIEAYIWGSFLLPWHFRWLFDAHFGTNDRMAEVYNDLLFHGATYADLQKHGRPLISLDATDVDQARRLPAHDPRLHPARGGLLALSHPHGCRPPDAGSTYDLGVRSPDRQRRNAGQSLGLLSWSKLRA